MNKKQIWIALSLMTPCVACALFYVFRMRSRNETEQNEEAVSLAQDGPCAFGATDPIASMADCGVFLVATNSQEGAKKDMELQYLKIPSFEKQETKHATFLLTGGPGQSGDLFLELVVDDPNFLDVLRKHGDVVLLAHRGTKHSSMFLNCPEDIQDMDGCQHVFANELGVDLEGFSTADAANDLLGFVDLKGYKEVTLYGISYGTSLAVEILMQDQQSGRKRVKALVLDSLAKADDSFVNLNAFWKTMVLLNDSLMSKSDVSSPHEEESLLSLLVGTISEIGYGVFKYTLENGKETSVSTPEFLYDLYYQLAYEKTAEEIREHVALMHRAVHGALKNEDSLTRDIAKTTKGGGFGDETSFANGLKKLLWCNDSDFDTEKVNKDFHVVYKRLSQRLKKSQQNKLEKLKPLLNELSADANHEFETCLSWMRWANKLSVLRRVSDVPVLTLTGTFDPLTRPTTVRETMLYLDSPFSRSVFFDDGKHAVSSEFPCARKMIGGFIQSPKSDTPVNCEKTHE